jgi:Domain of unknown function (DUF4168)
MPILVPVMPAVTSPAFLVPILPFKGANLRPVQFMASASPSLTEDPTPEAQNTTLSADDIPSEKLTQFVTAYSGVMKLLRRNESLIQTAETEQESTRLQQAIETSAVRLIEQTGLTRSEYIQLLSLANLDDEFGEKIATLLQEKS